MMRTAVVCSVVLILFVSAVRGTPFTVCEVDGVKPLFQPSSVRLRPDIPRVGHTARFTISVSNNDVIWNSGKVTVNVYTVRSFFGKTITAPLTKESSDLCEHVDCPVGPGDVPFIYKRKMPSITPPGEYMVKVSATDGVDKLLMCVEVKFNIIRKRSSRGIVRRMEKEFDLAVV